MNHKNNLEQLGTTSPPSLGTPPPKEKQPTNRPNRRLPPPTGEPRTTWCHRVYLSHLGCRWRWTFEPSRDGTSLGLNMCSNGKLMELMNGGKVKCFDLYSPMSIFQETFENREPRYHMTKNPLEKYTMNWITRSIILEEAEVYLAMMPCVSLKRPKNGPQCSPVTRAEPPCHGDKDRWMLEGEGYCGYGGWNSGIKWLTWHLAKPGWNMTSS